MKNILLLSLLFAFVISIESCRDEEMVWMDQAEITGYDYSLCPCCGGFFIEIEGEGYRFYELPDDSPFGINSETVFPISVNVNWHPMENACLGDEIILDEIELAE